MKAKDNLRIYIYLVVAWVALLVMQHFAHLRLKPGNLLTYAVDSLAPIPIIVLVVVFLFGLLMESRDQRSRKRQLMFIKSCMFRLELRDLYIADFLALKSPAVTFAEIRTASADDLRRMRREADNVEFKSLEAMEPVITEYVKAREVWRSFMNMAGEGGFDDIFQDMLYIMHFIGDVTTFREINPDMPFVRHAATNAALMEKVRKILGDGIRKYLEYVTELKEKQPELFDQVLSDYEALAVARGSAPLGASANESA